MQQTLTKVLANSARDRPKKKLQVFGVVGILHRSTGKNNAINCNAYTEPTSCICNTVERCVQTTRKTCISTDIAACIVNMCCLQYVTLYETNNAEQLEKTGDISMWGGWDGTANEGGDEWWWSRRPKLHINAQFCFRHEIVPLFYGFRSTVLRLCRAKRFFHQFNMHPCYFSSG